MTDILDRYRIVETLTESQVSDLMELYKNEFWCNRRTREIESISLGCLPNMIPFYERWGFTDDVGEIKFMRRKKP